MANRQIQAGFTMMELIVVVAIAGILASLAAPAFSSFINSTKQSSITSQLYSDLNRARSEAIKRNSRVLFCKRDATGIGCINGTQYHTSGWLVCYDTNNDDVCDTSTATAPNPIVLHAAPSNMTLVLTRADGTTTPIRFNPNGTQGTAAATLTVTGSWSGSTAQTVNIAATGNIYKH